MISASIGVLLLACGWVVTDSQFCQAEIGPTAIVVASDAAFRSGCGEEFGAIPGIELSEGSQFRVIQRRGNWCQVELSNGKKDWLKSTDVEVV